MRSIFAMITPADKKRLRAKDRAKDIARLVDEIKMHKSEIELAQAELDVLITEYDIEHYVANGITWQDMAWDLHQKGIGYPDIVKRCNNAWCVEDSTPLTYDRVYSYIYKLKKKIEKYEKLNAKTDTTV